MLCSFVHPPCCQLAALQKTQSCSQLTAPVQAENPSAPWEWGALALLWPELTALGRETALQRGGWRYDLYIRMVQILCEETKSLPKYPLQAPRNCVTSTPLAGWGPVAANGPLCLACPGADDHGRAAWVHHRHWTSGPPTLLSERGCKMGASAG